MNFIKNLLTQNLGAKFLSLGLACVLWFFVSSETIDQVTLKNIPVTIKLQSKQEGLTLEEETIYIDKLTLKGPREIVNTMNRDLLEAVYELNQDAPGSFNIDFRNVNFFRLPTDLIIKDFEPKSKLSKVVRLSTKWVEVIPVYDETMINAEGLALDKSKIVIEPEKLVEIRGPQELISSINEVKTHTVVLKTDVEGLINRYVKLDLPEGVSTSTQVKVKFTIVTKPIEKEFAEVDIGIIRPSTSLNVIELEKKTIDIVLVGSKRDLEFLKAEDILVFVDVRNDTTGTYTLPLQMKHIVNVKLKENPQVKVTIKPIE